MYQFTHANSIHDQDHLLTYAAPCEAVKSKSDLLSNLSKQLQVIAPSQLNRLIEQFWQKIKAQQTPIVEPINENFSRVIYLWRGAKQNVRLVGGPSNDHEWLTRIPKTDIWFKEAIVKDEARLLQYLFLRNTKLSTFIH